MKLFKNKEAMNAIYIGLLCTVSYLGCYFARNVLGVVTPQMLEENIFSVEYIGYMSTGFMILYAAGQLINGRMGDIIRTKFMVSCGIILAGIANVLIVILKSAEAVVAIYSMSGFFLSMIYAPIMKVVAENTLPVYASRCSLGFVVASFLGTPLASVMAMFFKWKAVFMICGITLIIVGAAAYLCFSVFEKRGIVRYGRVKKDEKGGFNLGLLIERNIIRFTIISVLTGIVRTSVIFWIPTYLSDYLSFSPSVAAGIFTVITLIKSASPYFNTIIVYEWIFKRNMANMLLWMFALSTACFAGMYFIHNQILNIVMLVVALVISAGAATLLFSIYCPSLGDTGMVSTATGYLDCMSYVGAAVANMLFANAINTMGWGNLILVWAALMAAGTATGIVKREKLKVKI